MQSLWNDQDAAAFDGDLGLRVYTSRLLGREPSLVLHGGGNTSVKVRERNVLGDDLEVLYVKGSGWDLASIEGEGFAPVDLAHVLRLAELERLSDLDMVNELRTHTLRATAPTPSVEAILHGVIPYRYVDHTHADALVTLTNTAEGEARVKEVYGDGVVIIPYVMPGFDLARECTRRFRVHAHGGTLGMVLMNHGLFSFGDTAREAYERMIRLVSMAEDYLKGKGAWERTAPPVPVAPADRVELAELRGSISRAAGFPVVMRREADPEVMAFVGRADLASVAQRGPATPDHVIRTKRLPLVGQDVQGYGDAYRAYFEANRARARGPVEMLDPAPRVVLDPQLGMLSVGRRPGDTAIVADIYRHTLRIIQRSEELGGYRPLPEGDIFEVEYWELEQAKLRRGGGRPEFQGEIALVTGAASGIGRACADAFLSRGAAVVGLDLDPKIKEQRSDSAFLGLVADVTDREAMAGALDQAVNHFGGLDMLVLNAGMFPGGCPVKDLSDTEWRGVMAVNLDANLALLRESYPLLRRAPGAGRVVVIGSRNVPAPGPGAAAYSSSKAALTQLARVAALEWGGQGMRVNVLHPDAVFDTGIWTPEVLADRASRYGMSVSDYKTRNLLKTEVASRDVAELAAELCGPRFARTTGAQIPVDGGNDRVI